MLISLGCIAGDRNSVSWKLKHNVIEGITELLQDIDDYHTQVAEQAIEHIHQKYVMHICRRLSLAFYSLCYLSCYYSLLGMSLQVI